MYNNKNRAFLLGAHLKSALGLTRHQSRSVAGRTWHWLEAGDPNASETLVLLHGLSMNKGHWHSVITEFAKHRRVIAPDIPGLNLSVPAHDPDAGLDGIARELTSFLNCVVNKPVHLLGHSMAAPLCLNLSLRLAVPVKTISMVSLADVQLTDSQSLSLSIERMSDFIRELTLEQHCDYVASMFYRPPLGVRLIARSSWPDLNANKAHIVSLLAAMEREMSQLEEHKDALVMPVLVLNGQHDLWFDITRCSDLFARPNVTRVELEECRHLPFMEQPRAFVASIEDFIRSSRQDARESN